MSRVNTERSLQALWLDADDLLWLKTDEGWWSMPDHKAADVIALFQWHMALPPVVKPETLYVRHTLPDGNLAWLPETGTGHLSS